MHSLLMLIHLKYMYVSRIINNMKRKFNHEQIVMVGGLVAIIGVITFNLLTNGI